MNKPAKTTARWFNESEFKKCSPACSLQDMRQSTMDKLDSARDIAGIPLVLNSAYRSPAYEKEMNRTGTGAHPERCAVDIKCNTSRNRFLIVEALVMAGFKRIGIAKTFIHADDSETHDQQVIWLYK